ncbi:MAG: LacI family DNA-binding transcriptional regulator [Armatimonadota bacterium]|nr:LacI family transcriptional regulator [bacterium]MDW8289967.1 LacI family DNA-binding transcriptional regulator [Armatimonadota bacterium]
MSSLSRRKRRSTLDEVARRAGVSRTTASLVLSGKATTHRISEETYRRVQEAAQALDYSPNLLVRSLQRGRTHVLSFFNAFRLRAVNDLYMDRLSTAVERAAGKLGYDVLVHCDFSRPPEETYRFLNGGRADGLLLFAPLPDDPLLPLLRRSRLPVVLLNARDCEGTLPSVRDDVESGMRQVAETLVALGHRRIAAVIEEGSDFRDAVPRVRLLQRYLRELGGDLPEHCIHSYWSERRQVLDHLLSEPHPPTAVFCWRDWLAYRLLEDCDRLGVEVPSQLSVLGYDGLHWPATTRHVAASVHVDLNALAEAAVYLLHQYIVGEREDTADIAIPVQLHFGTTLDAAPASSRI